MGRTLLLVTACLVALSGCSKLTKANYDALSMGMSQDEVTAVIGKPDNCSETMGTQSCVWGKEGDTYIKVVFIADNATAFSNNGLK